MQDQGQATPPVARADVVVVVGEGGQQAVVQDVAAVDVDVATT